MWLDRACWLGAMVCLMSVALLSCWHVDSCCFRKVGLFGVGFGYRYEQDKVPGFTIVKSSITLRKSSVLLPSVPSCSRPVRIGNELGRSSSTRRFRKWACASGGVSDEELRIKNGGSLSAKEALLSRNSLLDFSNHFSALLLSPELSLLWAGREDRVDGGFARVL